MSCIICIATSGSAIIAGDGRAINLDTGEIISENYQKVVQVRNDIIAGFSGTEQVSLRAFDDLPNDIDTLSFFNIAEILCAGAKKRHKDTGLKGNIILAGIENGHIALYRFSQNNDYELERIIPISTELLGIYPDNITHDILYECFEKYYDASGLYEVIKQTFKQVSSLSDSVNQNISCLYVEAPH